MIKNVNQVFPEYKGQYNGWWKNLKNDQKCDTSSGKPKENGEIKEGKWVCLGDLGILKGEEKKNGQENGKEKEYEWEIYKGNDGAGRTTNNRETYKHYSDGSNLFKFWEDKKDWFKTATGNGTSTGLPDLKEIRREKRVKCC